MGFWLSTVLSISLSKQKEKQEPSLFSSASREEEQLRDQFKGERQLSHPKAGVLQLMPSSESPLAGRTDHLTYVHGGVQRRSLSSLPLSYQAADRQLWAFRPFANLKSPSRDSCKTVGEKLAHSSFLPRPFPPLLFA